VTHSWVPPDERRIWTDRTHAKTVRARNAHNLIIRPCQTIDAVRSGKIRSTVDGGLF